VDTTIVCNKSLIPSPTSRKLLCNMWDYSYWMLAPLYNSLTSTFNLDTSTFYLHTLQPTTNNASPHAAQQLSVFDLQTRWCTHLLTHHRQETSPQTRDFRHRLKREEEIPNRLGTFVTAVGLELILIKNNGTLELDFLGDTRAS
jgi:hypothetical protein